MPRVDMRVRCTPEQAARVRVLCWVSQLLYERAALSVGEMLDEGLDAIEARMRSDAEGRGVDWGELLTDAGLLSARHARVTRGESPPREYGTGVLRPGQAKESTGGFGSLGIRPVHHEDRE